MSKPISKVHSLSAAEKKVIVIAALSKEGYNENETASLMGISRQRVNQVNAKLKAGVLTPLVSKAKKSIKMLLEGKPVGGMTEVRGSDILGAAKMVMDRAEPIIQKVEQRSFSAHIDLTPQERDKYQKLLGLDKIPNAEFEPVQEKPMLMKPEQEE